MYARIRRSDLNFGQSTTFVSRTSIFQSKDEHEIGSARPEGERHRRMSRPRSGRLPFFVFWVYTEDRRRHRGGNVKIPPGVRDFQGALGRVENPDLVFHAFHSPGISTARRPFHRNGGGNGERTLH